MEPITFFTTPKPYEGRDGRNERDFRNAARTWMRLKPTPEVLVFGGSRRIAEEEGARYVDFHPCNERGLPYINTMIEIAEQVSSNDILVLTSDHLMFMHGMMRTLERILHDFPDNFLVMGQRSSTVMDRFLDFDDGEWKYRLEAQVAWAGQLQGPAGKDYFIFRRPLGLDIPPFVAGRPAWDSWIVRAALDAGIRVLDATPCIRVIHAYHDILELREREQDVDTIYNRSLCTPEDLKGSMISDAPWVITHDAIKRR